MWLKYSRVYGHGATRLWASTAKLNANKLLKLHEKKQIFTANQPTLYFWWRPHGETLLELLAIITCATNQSLSIFFVL